MPISEPCSIFMWSLTHPKGRKRKSASLCTPVQSHFQPKKTRTASTLAIAMLVAEHYGSPIKIRNVDKESALILQFLESDLLAVLKLTID